MKEKLAYCETFEEQAEWCRNALLAGKTLTYPGIFLGGGDPDRIIRHLRRKVGMPIKTVYVKTIDAAGTVHPRTLAWRLEEVDSSLA
ncbi:hypothetical protein [Sulfuricystis multivorans]|uniref:hypothetical protein n=1 Tax=Sulfuricystis multivorans TaxID=2211108 RepID=UPI000F81679F|nr:hypothetical protein [Sulfuricystis multivorans]